MKLTKQQIEEIDNRLEQDGIKYWDIRIELLDHVVTDIENRLEKGEELERAVTNSFNSLGWNGDLKQINREGWQNVNNRFRREYHKGFLNFFKSLKNSSLFVLGVVVFNFLSSVLTFSVFKNVCVIAFGLPLVFVIYSYATVLIKKYGKSVNLDYGLFYLILSFLILQAIPIFFKNQTELTQKIVWISILSIHYVSIYAGYNLYKKAVSKVESIRNQLLS